MTLPTPHALRIPEILSMIFGFADLTVNAVNAQVCKLWLNLALDVLWEEVDDLPRLFGILSPVKRDMDSGYYEFEYPPSENDWKRFEKYATRVRRLKCCTEFGSPALGDDSLEILDQTRRRLEILPNLQTLEWDLLRPGDLRSVRIFMHSRVKKFVIYLRPGQQLQIFFEDVVARMPDLTILDIRSMLPVQDIQEDFVHLFQGLPKLQSVNLPWFYFTTKIAECLSHVEYLSSIDFQTSGEQDVDSSVGVTSFNPTFTEGAFPLLSRLSMLTSLDDAARFVKTSFSPNKLTQFCSFSYFFIDSTDSVHRLLSVLSENYQMLQELELLSKMDSPTTNFTDKPGYITLDTLKPIIKLPHLVVFQLHHPYPLLMTQQDVECLASSCQALENLSLCVDSLYLTESTLTPAALIPFAQHCPKLEYLGLFMDATAGKVPEISLTAAPRPFKSLRHLCVGYSVIDEWLTPAVYFSHLLAPDCEIETSVLWDEDALSEELSDIIAERGRLWHSVRSLVPTLSKVRAQERRRMLAILEDPHANVAMLQDPWLLA